MIRFRIFSSSRFAPFLRRRSPPVAEFSPPRLARIMTATRRRFTACTLVTLISTVFTGGTV